MKAIPQPSAEGRGKGKHPPNRAMLLALAEIETIQSGMRPKEDRDAADHLQTARAGEMYGYGNE